MPARFGAHLKFLTLSAGESHDERSDGEDDAGAEDGRLAPPPVGHVAAEQRAREGRRDSPRDDQLVPDGREMEILE